MNISDYLEQVRAKYASGQATEHSYRPALQALFESIDPALTVINEPKRSDTGMPDFLFTRDGIPLGWAEPKDQKDDLDRALLGPIRTGTIAEHPRSGVSGRREESFFV